MQVNGVHSGQQGGGLAASKMLIEYTKRRLFLFSALQWYILCTTPLRVNQYK